MINTTTSKNRSWDIGQVVKVGFLSLRVVGCQAVKDYMPDIYTLESLDQTRRYQFIPHHGLMRLE